MKRMFSLLLALLTPCAAVAAGSQAKDAPLPPAAQEIKLAHEQAVGKVVQPLRERYDAGIKDLLGKATQSGKLDEAVELKAELAIDPATSAVNPKLSREAQQLKTDYQRSIQEKAEPLDEQYRAQLTGQMQQAMQAGRLEDAIAIRNEVGPSIGHFENTHWAWYENATLSGNTKHWIELYDRGLAKDDWNSAVRWQMVGRTLILTQSDGRTWRFPIDFTNKQGIYPVNAHNDEPRSIRFERMLK